MIYNLKTCISSITRSILSAFYPLIQKICKNALTNMSSTLIVRNWVSLIQKQYIFKKKKDLKNIELIQFPILLKPSKREDLKRKVFRNLKIDSPRDLNKVKRRIERYLDAGIKFLASEIIPGDENCIYAYVAYRDMNGKILNEWTGKKLTQYPDSFGVFASASNEAPEDCVATGKRTS